NAADSSPTGPGSGGLPPNCSASMTVSQDGQTAPVAGPGETMRITSQVAGAPGVLQYTWGVQVGGAAADYTRIDDGAAIDVPVPQPGIYHVALQVGGALSACSPATATISVAAPGALSARIRLRVVPSRSVAAPATEQLFDILGGAASDLGPIRVDAGQLFHP